jgi:ribose transport system ATP-binding protein
MSAGRITGFLTAEQATQESVMHLATLRPDDSVADAIELGLVEPQTIQPSGMPTTEKAG